MLVDIQQESTSMPQGTPQKSNSKTKEPQNSFESLLQGIKEPLSEDEKLQKGAFVLSLDDTPQELPKHMGIRGDNLTKEPKSSEEKRLSLSKNLAELLQSQEDIAGVEEDTEIMLNSKVTAEMSLEELKQMVYDAKNYLRDQIKQSEAYLRSEASVLPKTLKGLAQFAQKLDIDVSKITLESLQDEKPKQIVNINKSKPKVATQKLQTDAQQQQNAKLSLEQQRNENKQLDSLPKKVQNEPLLQVQSSKNEVSTAEFVAVKLQNQKPTAQTTKKEKADETLKLLLQGESQAKTQKSGLTQDFSTATARVIAPKLSSERDAGLESLLMDKEGDTREFALEDSSKSENTQKVLKAESFEVKLNEAKQMTKYLSQDVKTAIDNYKAPFTRLKVQLNPERFGEIELTVVQRGKNLHVNLSSNNAAINALAMNANDLKLQLQNSGINNASLNFSNNSNSPQQGAFSNSGEAQQQHNQQKNDAYSYYESDEQNEEIISSLEIVVPYYA